MRKPDWALTNVGWEVRKVVWLLWAMGETLPQTVIFLDLHADEFPDRKDRKYQIDTLKKVRRELETVPPELLDRLIAEEPGVKSFIMAKRTDYIASQEKVTVKIGRVKEYDYTNVTKLIKDFYIDRDPSLGLKVLTGDDIELKDY